MKVINQENEVQSLNNIIAEYDKTIKKLREDNNTLRNESLSYEKQITQLKEERDVYRVKLEQNLNNNESQLYQIEIMKKQIESIRHTLGQTEHKAQEYLAQKMEATQKKFLDIINSSMNKNLLKGSPIPSYLEMNKQSGAEQTILAKAESSSCLPMDKRCQPYLKELKAILSQAAIANNRLCYLMKLLEESCSIDPNLPLQSQSQLQMAQTLLKYEVFR